MGTDRRLHGVEIAERDLIEAVDLGTKALDVFKVAASGERRQRAPVKRALEGDEAIALGSAIGRVKLARSLDRAFNGLGARIGEEHAIGESGVDKPAGQRLGLRNLEEIGYMPRLLGRRAQGFHKARMRMAKRVHGDARAKIEIAVAIGGDEPSALSPLEGEVRARISGKQRRSQKANSIGRRPSARAGARGSDGEPL